MNAALVTSLCVGGCQKTGGLSVDQNIENKAANVQLNQDWVEGTELFFLLLPQKIVMAEKNPPDGFYVKGLVNNKNLNLQARFSASARWQLPGAMVGLSSTLKNFILWNPTKKL